MRLESDVQIKTELLGNAADAGTQEADSQSMCRRDKAKPMQKVRMKQKSGSHHFRHHRPSSILRRREVCERNGVRSNKSIFMFGFFSKYVMIGASELSIKSCCQSWEDSDTPPVLKESDFHFHSEQNQQRIDTLIIQARRQFHNRANHARHCCHLPLRIPRVLASLHRKGPGTRIAERNQKKHTGDHNF